MRWLRISALLQLVLGVYFQLVCWIPLGPWNDQGGANNRPLIERLRAGTPIAGDAAFAAIFLAVPLVFGIAVRLSIRWLMWVCACFYAVWLYLQIKSWWVPYVFGASPSWREVQARVFSRTLKILPSFGNHLAPDAMHLTIQVLLAAALGTAMTGMWPARSARLNGSRTAGFRA